MRLLFSLLYHDSMRDIHQRAGLRDELIEHLRSYYEYCNFMGKSRNSDEADQAIKDLRDGASTVTAGHTTYVVTAEKDDENDAHA